MSMKNLSLSIVKKNRINKRSNNTAWFWKTRTAVFLVSIVVANAFLLCAGVNFASAAEARFGYSALMVSSTGSSEIRIAPGEEKTISVDFQNISTSVWKPSGTRFVSIYTYEPKYRKSVFEHSSWYKYNQPAKISAETAAGKTGTISFKVKAPKTSGIYSEVFNLAAEDLTWIPGGKFTIKFNVTNEKSTVAAAPAQTSQAGSLSAQIAVTSANLVRIEGGKPIVYTVGFKNTGTKSWMLREIRTPDVQIASTQPQFMHSSWLAFNIATATKESPVMPGQMDVITFSLTSPKYAGKYNAKFQLVADNSAVSGGLFEIPIEVTSNAPGVIDAPYRDESVQVSYIEEPIIRVGVLTVDEETNNEAVIASESVFEMRDGAGALLGTFQPSQSVRALYKNGQYFYDSGSGLVASVSYLRFVPLQKNAVMTVTNFDRRVTRGTAYALNTFRNILEIRHNDAKDRVWLINELPMDTYLKGLAETSNSSPMEYQKALMIAARTYAFYHWQRATKHDEEFYHVDAYYDQVYKGQGYEAMTPNISRAVDETRGMVVTFNNETAITPYFSRSDGRTRDWSEVWYGSVEWLKSVQVPCDVGRTLWGHGVGLSASGALCMANEGKTFQEILKHFYKGIEVQKRWQ
ncbi:TPA: hypothetical protein DCZ32_01690 [Candidatus Uhrbacteria bacterium]|nr:hypothetical protein [Candidatus Uhrbacteria bacterium]